MHMIEKMAWNTFKNTGNINTFLELKQLDNIELNLIPIPWLEVNNLFTHAIKGGEIEDEEGQE